MFSCHDNTDKVFLDIGKPIVHSVLQGKNGTVFAYGQTAAGKTYTMQGLLQRAAMLMCEFQEKV